MSRPDNKKNLRSEKEGIRYLRKRLNGFYLPKPVERKDLLKKLGLPERYSRSFDVVSLKVPKISAVSKPSDVQLIEIKVTREFLPEFPKGFFFGITKNEVYLMRKHPKLFRLCLISINRKKKEHILLTYKQFKGWPKNKRVQYQINLK